MNQPKITPIPEGMHTVTPHLICAGAADAIAFYEKAFGAVEVMRLAAPDGKLMHASIRIGDSTVMLMDEMPDCSAHALGPKSLQGTPVGIHLYVEDADTLFAQAVEAGAEVILPLQDMFWGDRYGVVADPFGHHWSIAMRVRDLSPDELHQAAREIFEAMA